MPSPILNGLRNDLLVLSNEANRKLCVFNSRIMNCDFVCSIISSVRAVVVCVRVCVCVRASLGNKQPSINFENERLLFTVYWRTGGRVVVRLRVVG